MFNALKKEKQKISYFIMKMRSVPSAVLGTFGACNTFSPNEWKSKRMNEDRIWSLNNLGVNPSSLEKVYLGVYVLVLPGSSVEPREPEHFREEFQGRLYVDFRLDFCFAFDFLKT